MCIRDSYDDRHTIAALYALSQSVNRISSQQHRKGHVPVSYTHLDVYKRQTQAKEQAAEKTEHRTIDREKVKVKDRSVQR